MKSKVLEEIEQELQGFGYTTSMIETVDGVSRGRVDYEENYTYFAYRECGVKPKYLYKKIHEELRKPENESREGG